MQIEMTFEARGGRAYGGHEGTLIIANHISYLDVMVLAAYAPGVFITSREIGNTPGLGQIVRAAGCLFVERRNYSTLLRDIDDLSSTLNDGLNVVVFPEGTTTDGCVSLLPFKSSLLESSLRSRGRVAPFCIRYTHVDGAPLDRANCDRIAWYGPMRFLPHLLQLLTVKRVDVRLTALPPLPLREHKSRKVLAKTARDMIGRVYGEPHP